MKTDGKRGVMDKDKNMVIPPALEDGLGQAIPDYKRGFPMVGSNKRRGLSTAGGTEILPSIFPPSGSKAVLSLVPGRVSY